MSALTTAAPAAVRRLDDILDRGDDLLRVFAFEPEAERRLLQEVSATIREVIEATDSGWGGGRHGGHRGPPPGGQGGGPRGR